MTAAAAPASEPVAAVTRRASVTLVNTKHAIESRMADAPVRYQASTCEGSALSRCGRGSQTAPIWRQPGVRLSKMRRATTRCPLAS